MNPKRNRARDVGFYVLLVLILIAVIFTMTKDTEPDQLDNYSELVDLFNAGKVQSFRTEGNKIILKLRTDGSGYKKVSKKLKALLDDPKSDIQKTYDLTKKADIDNYLSWYRLMKRVVRTATVKSIEKFRYPEPGALDLFKQKVEAHNAEFRQMEENTEEECTE